MDYSVADFFLALIAASVFRTMRQVGRDMDLLPWGK